MRTPQFVVAVAASALLFGAPAVAHAQHRGGGGGGHSRGSSGGAAPRGGGGGGGGPRAGGSGGGFRGGGGAQRSAPQNFGGMRSYAAPRSIPGGARSFNAAPRSFAYGPSRSYGGGFRGGVVVGRSYPRGVVGSRVFVGSRGYGPVRFVQPYYSFRPRVSLGFGLWAGFPIAYYDAFYDPFAYGYAYPYPAYSYPYPAATAPGYPAPAYPSTAYPPAPYPSNGSIGVQPGGDPSVQQQPELDSTNAGGVSFEITPSDAQVFVDGTAVGTVGQFGPNSQPLGLTPGRHRIEIQAPGYQPVSIDADIVAGQVIPYQGTLQR